MLQNVTQHFDEKEKYTEHKMENLQGRGHTGK
jgi:hypothetical protein